MRFQGCFAILPLPHIKETLEFIERASSLPTPPDGYGVTTAMGKNHQSDSDLFMAHNAAGKRYLGDPAFEPVWAALSKQGSVVFVHPADTVMPPNIPFGPCKNNSPRATGENY